MTSNIDVVKEWLEAGWTNPPASVAEAAEKYLSDDFQTVDEDGNVVMNKETYIGMGQLLFAAFEDFNWVLADLREEGDRVIMTGHFEGTHTGDLDLSVMGAGVVPASGRKIVWDEVSVGISVQGGKVLREEPYGGAAGVEAFLAKLRMEAPSD